MIRISGQIFEKLNKSAARPNLSDIAAISVGGDFGLIAYGLLYNKVYEDVKQNVNKNLKRYL